MGHKNAVLVGLENMKKYEGHDESIVYTMDGQNYTNEEMIREIETDSDIGREFSQLVYDTIISYLGKFGQKL